MIWINNVTVNFAFSVHGYWSIIDHPLNFQLAEKECLYRGQHLMQDLTFMDVIRKDILQDMNSKSKTEMWAAKPLRPKKYGMHGRLCLILV